MASNTLAICRRTMQPGHERIGRTMLLLGRVLVQQNKFVEAGPLLQDALALFRDKYPNKPVLAAQAENWLGAILLSRRQYPEAEHLLLPGSDLLFLHGMEMSPNEKRTALDHIVQLYRNWGKPDQAALWQKKLEGLEDNKGT